MVLNEKFLPGLADGKTVFYQDINREFLTPEGTIPEGLLWGTASTRGQGLGEAEFPHGGADISQASQSLTLTLLALPFRP